MPEAHNGCPTVSVIVPAYNSERYLEAALRSVCAQTFQDFEIIVVDDGSTDGTAGLAEGFRQHDERIRVIHQRNRGISAARNAGTAASYGRVVALLDSDDMWLPEYLERQLAVLEKHPGADIVSANAINFGGRSDGELWKATAPGCRSVSLLDLIEDETSVCIMSMFRRRVIDLIGGFDTTLRGSEDYDYWLRAAVHGLGILFNGAPLAYYRRRPDSVSADESMMLEAIQVPLRKVRQQVPAGSPEAAAIDRQLERFERERLMSAAKRQLLLGDATGASEHLSVLAARTGALKHRTISFVADRLPLLLTWAYGLKRTGRGLRS